MNGVMMSRQAGQLFGYLSRKAMNELMDEMSRVRDSSELPPMYRSWLEDRANVSYRYLSNTAKLAIKQRRGQSV